MIRTDLKLFSILNLVFVSLVSSSCSSKSKPPAPTVFMGHTIGESSMGWASAENSNGDPLSNCQAIIRSPLLEGFREQTEECRKFVNNGDYLVIIPDSPTRRARAYRFMNWRLVLIVIQLRREDEDNLIMELNSRFTVAEKGKEWLGEDGASIEIRPNEEFRLFTGKTLKLDGFLVVISSPDAR